MDYNISLYWENKPNTQTQRHEYLNKCLKTIKKHNKNVIVVTPENIYEYIPKNRINKKIWKLDLIVQRSDYFRYLLIHHNGGLWLGFDTICFKNCDKFLTLLNKHEILLHTEAFFTARKGLLGEVVKEISNKLDDKLTRKYLIIQSLKKLLNQLNIKKTNYKITPFKWTEIGKEVFVKHIKNLKTYTIPNIYFDAKAKGYSWELKNNIKICSREIEVSNFLHKEQLIIKLYNSFINLKQLI